MKTLATSKGKHFVKVANDDHVSLLAGDMSKAIVDAEHAKAFLDALPHERREAFMEALREVKERREP